MNRFLLFPAMVLFVQIAMAQSVYKRSFELTTGAIFDDYSKTSLGIYTTHGIQSRNCFVGLGVGFRSMKSLYYSSSIDKCEGYRDRYLVPAYIRASYRFGEMPDKIMISFDIGIAVDVGTEEWDYHTGGLFQDGLFFEPDLVICHAANEKISLYISIGYNFQNTFYKYYSWDTFGVVAEEKSEMARTLILKLGVSF